MANQRLNPQELAFINELEKYEDKWVAIIRNGDDERIVASGTRLKEAKQQANERGFRDVVFMKVPSSHKILISTVQAAVQTALNRVFFNSRHLSFRLRRRMCGSGFALPTNRPKSFRTMPLGRALPLIIGRKATPGAQPKRWGPFTAGQSRRLTSGGEAKFRNDLWRLRQNLGPLKANHK